MCDNPSYLVFSNIAWLDIACVWEQRLVLFVFGQYDLPCLVFGAVSYLVFLSGTSTIRHCLVFVTVLYLVFLTGTSIVGRCLV